MQAQQVDFPFEIPSKGVIKRRINESFTQKKVRETQQSERLYQYLKKIEKLPPKSVKEENRLWKRIKEREKDKEAEKELVRAYLKKVIPVAEKYKDNPYLTFLELILAGTEGLYEVIKTFRWRTRQKPPSHYLIWWIRKGISDAIRQKRRLLLYGRNAEIFVWKDKNGNITRISFSYTEDGMHGNGTYEGTVRKKQQYGQKIIEAQRELAKAEEEISKRERTERDT